MLDSLYRRIDNTEKYSADLMHEIRNPLASLKSASELLDKTTEKNEGEKLLKTINHDAERIERLITDYTQMLKDEASLSREKMSKINLIEIINGVVEDFNQDLINQNKKIEIRVINKIKTKNGLKYLNAKGTITLPKKTYLSVPGLVIHAGCQIKFEDFVFLSKSSKIDESISKPSLTFSSIILTRFAISLRLILNPCPASG